MNTASEVRRRSGMLPPATALFLALLVSLVPAATVPELTLPPEAPPETPRQFFNAGTQKLAANKLREAEAFLESVLASQTDQLQPSALYNLGHVRFRQGGEELKKGPAARPAAARGRAAAHAADAALESVNEALGGEDVRKMVAAYLQGRGVRRELKAAAEVVKRALETYGTALNKWQRSSGDFKSALELAPLDRDARENADTVDRSIAKLIDSLRELQQVAAAVGDKSQELGEKLKELKGRIPAQDMPPGAAGEDEEEEDYPNGPKEGQKEGPTREGEEMSISREQAGWLLKGFRLDSERRLPMGQSDTAEPKNRSGRTW